MNKEPDTVIKSNTEKTQLSNTVSLPVMEHFYTLQGEGRHQGRAAYFIRLGGCDVGCTWCDVKESWDLTAHPVLTINNLLESIQATPAQLVVITGGEPLLHKLDALTAALKQAGYETNLETSGSSSLSGHWDWICLSPKKFKAPLDEVIINAHELKIVVFHKSDLLWAESFTEKVGPNCLLYLQPEWSKASQMTPLILDYIKTNPQWRLSLQVHKYLNIP